MKIQPEQPIRVALCIPSGDTVRLEFAVSMAAMVNRTHSTPHPLLEAIGIINLRSPVLPNSRERITNQALQDGYTHLLWIDSDMVFPNDSLLRLLAHGVECVGVNAVRRSFPISFTAQTKPGEYLETRTESSGLEKVYRMGFGMLLIEAAAVRKIKKRPLFSLEWIGNQGIHRGEDFFFCGRLRKAGVTMYVDHDLTKEVGHVGSMTYYPAMGEK